MKKYARPYFSVLSSYLNSFLDSFYFLGEASSIERSEDSALTPTDSGGCWARSSAWLEHWSYTPSVGGSNPPGPKPFPKGLTKCTA